MEYEMRKWVAAFVLAIVCTNATVDNAKSSTWLSREELKCLTDNVYFEARGESFEGQVAVARVTLNRVGLFAPTVCKVVYQKKQFSWTGKGYRVTDAYAWERAWHAAWHAREYDFKATHFHTKQVKPYWSKKLTRITTINNHIFYS